MLQKYSSIIYRILNCNVLMALQISRKRANTMREDSSRLVLSVMDLVTLADNLEVLRLLEEVGFIPTNA